MASETLHPLTLDVMEIASECDTQTALRRINARVLTQIAQAQDRERELQRWAEEASAAVRGVTAGSMTGHVVVDAVAGLKAQLAQAQAEVERLRDDVEFQTTTRLETEQAARGLQDRLAAAEQARERAEAALRAQMIALMALKQLVDDAMFQIATSGVPASALAAPGKESAPPAAPALGTCSQAAHSGIGLHAEQKWCLYWTPPAPVVQPGQCRDSGCTLVGTTHVHAPPAAPAVASPEPCAAVASCPEWLTTQCSLPGGHDGNHRFALPPSPAAEAPHCCANCTAPDGSTITPCPSQPAAEAQCSTECEGECFHGVGPHKRDDCNDPFDPEVGTGKRIHCASDWRCTVHRPAPQAQAKEE